MAAVQRLQANHELGEFRIQHGAPERWVTDGGGLFRAKHLLTILERLGVVTHEIARRQAWQTYIEAIFGIQRRRADWGFALAGTWPELLAVHEEWVTEHNSTKRGCRKG